MHLIALHDSAGFIVNFYSTMRGNTHDYLIKYFTPHCLLRDIIIITLFITSLSIFVLQETLGNSDPPFI